jgi:hypothetical protein
MVALTLQTGISPLLQGISGDGVPPARPEWGLFYLIVYPCPANKRFDVRKRNGGASDGLNRPSAVTSSPQ